MALLHSWKFLWKLFYRQRVSVRHLQFCTFCLLESVCYDTSSLCIRGIFFILSIERLVQAACVGMSCKFRASGDWLLFQEGLERNDEHYSCTFIFSRKSKNFYWKRSVAILTIQRGMLNERMSKEFYRYCLYWKRYVLLNSRSMCWMSWRWFITYFICPVTINEVVSEGIDSGD